MSESIIQALRQTLIDSIDTKVFNPPNAISSPANKRNKGYRFRKA